MKTIVLWATEYHIQRRIAGVIVCNHIYFDEDVEKALKAHLEKVYRAINIRLDRTTYIVHFTAGGAAPYDTSLQVQIKEGESVSVYTRKAITAGPAHAPDDCGPYIDDSDRLGDFMRCSKCRRSWPMGSRSPCEEAFHQLDRAVN